MPSQTSFVIDGGALLHKVPWPKCSTYLALCDLYVNYVKTHFGTNTIVIFDGYQSGPTTKDEAHQCRAGCEMGVEIDISLDMLCKMKKKQFLSNVNNKQKFLYLLGPILVQNGINVTHAQGDADYDIVMSACRLAETETSVTIVCDDTDILVLILYYINPCTQQIIMKTSSNMIDVGTMKREIGPILSSMILFVHALTGCDTVSKPYGLGKMTAVSKVELLKEYGTVFMNENSSQTHIEEAGQQALSILYGCTNLNQGRAAKFRVKVLSSSKYVPPERLPPTIDAANFHNRRVFHQVQAWLGNYLQPTEWGWVLEKTPTGKPILKPTRMTQEAAPKSLLNIVKCNCSKACNTNICSCKKNGLKCTLACGKCKGISCLNVLPSDEDDFEDNEQTLYT